MSTQPIFDEAIIYHNYREPTPAEIMERFHYWDGKNWRDPWTNNRYMMGVEAVSREQADKERQRKLLKERRRIERERCLHGRRPYPVHWAEGTHPLGIREVYVNVEGMNGGPYLMSEGDHQILHNLGRKHEHVQTRQMSASKN